MTLVLLGAGGIAAGLGTRLAAALFGGSAVAASVSTMPAAATWIAATAALLMLVSPAPRSVALPALGAAAALAAGSAENTAVVLGLWVLATAAAVTARGPGGDGARWAFTLCASDVLVAAAVGWHAVTRGLEGWSEGTDLTTALLLLVAATVRAPLASGPSDTGPEAGLLIVRAQAAVLVLAGVGGSRFDRTLLIGVAVAAAAVFAVGSGARREVTRDVVQEISLLALVAALIRLGLAPAGWQWAALAGGTLIHSLRFTAASGGATAQLVRQTTAGAGWALPLLPAVLVGLEGAVHSDQPEGMLVALGLIGGLLGRSAVSTEPGQSSFGAGWPARIGILAAAGAFAVGVWAPLLTLVPKPELEKIPWPPAWALGVVIIAAGFGTALPAGRVARRPLVGLPDIRYGPREPSGRTLGAILLIVASSAITLWAAGAVRGFL